MEFAPEGDLEKILKKAKNKPLTEDQIYKVFAQIVLGLIDVHDAGMTHGDLKP
jgi:serine/threonine protein kinase